MAGTTETLTLSYKETVTPSGGKYVSSKALALDFSGSLDLDTSDRAIAKVIESEFKKQMKSQVKSQLKHLEGWLKEKDALVRDLVKKYEALEKASFPESPSEAKAYKKIMAEMTALSAKIDDLQNDYTQIVDDWATNCAQQQGLIALDMSLKKARIEVRAAKNRRVWLGRVVKGVLVVAAIAISITALVLSAGTLAPAFVGLAIAGTALSGGAGIIGYGKSIADNVNQEKRLLGNVKSDLKTLASALKPVDKASSSIAKHVTELTNLNKIRRGKLPALKSDVKKHTVALKSYRSKLSEVVRAPAIDLREFAKRLDKVDAEKAKLAALTAKITKMERDIQEADDLIKEIEDLGVDLDKVNMQAPSTILGNLKTRFTSLDGWLDLANEAGGLSSGVSGLGPS